MNKSIKPYKIILTVCWRIELTVVLPYLRAFAPAYPAKHQGM